MLRMRDFLLKKVIQRMISYLQSYKPVYFLQAPETAPAFIGALLNRTAGDAAVHFLRSDLRRAKPIEITLSRGSFASFGQLYSYGSAGDEASGLYLSPISMLFS
jgi:hypothetical protein